MVEKLLTVKEVCDILNIHENTLRRWADKGTFGEVYRMSTQGDRVSKYTITAYSIIMRDMRIGH